MKRVITLTAAACLALAVTGCGKSEPPASTPSSTPSSVVSSSASSTPVVTPSETPSSSAAAGSYDQSTPEGALMGLIAAMAAGDGRATCGLMSAKGLTLDGSPAALDACEKQIESTMDQMKALAGLLGGFSVKGATVVGDKATFEKATVEPEAFKELASQFTAVKVKGKWYVSQ